MSSEYFHQVIAKQADNTLLIKDPIHGQVIVSEPVLIDLVQSKAMERLDGVLQHGITALIGLTVPVTRLEHSVGAMLLVRQLGASVEEQAASLLHDVSHTALSHVVDHAFSGQGSFHEVHKNEFLVKHSDIPEILTRHGLDWRTITHEELFPLLEKDAPHLCADRLDYGLRDAVAFGALTLVEANEIVNHLVAFPSASDANRTIAIDDPLVARTFAEAYMTTDRTAWSNPHHIIYYQLAGDIIAEAFKQDCITDNMQLWTKDQVFWQGLKDKGSQTLKEMIDLCEDNKAQVFESDVDRAMYKLSLKSRTIDPDVVTISDDNGKRELHPLSALDQAYQTKRQAYMQAKKRVVGMNIQR